MSPRVAFFPTCLGDRFFAEACADAVRLLRHFGAEVDVPPDPTCCGQPAHNSGYGPEARRMARHTLRGLEGAEYVVLPSGSCASMLRRHAPELFGGPERERALALAERVYELSHFLVDVLGVRDVGDGLRGRKVAYHHGCHALRELRVDEQPLRLLSAAGAQVEPWPTDRDCCGFGGLFSAKLSEVSAAMADSKLDSLPRVDFVTSADGGCLLQLSGRADHRGLGPPFRHLASALWQGVRRP